MVADPDPSALSIASLAYAYARGHIDPLTVTQACLARIAEKDGALRSYITVATDGARAQARASGRRWADNRPLGPLDGVPIAVKDNIDVAGLACTAGTAAFRARIPSEDAPVVAELKRQGAVILGKLNMDEGALGATTDNPTYGRCVNPVRPAYTPGGSSGGSGAAVAARLCAAALGTDTMGSVRVPASYCGIWGFKSGNDAVSTEGVVPLSRTLDSVGVLARSAGDIAVMAAALLRTRLGGAAWPLAGLRIGVPRQIDRIDISTPVASAFEQFLARLSTAGLKIARIDLPAWHPGKARRAGLLISEAEAATYYARELGPELAGLSPGFISMLRYPHQAGRERIGVAYETVEALRLVCLGAFTEVELIALPTAPQTSFPHGEPPPANQADCTALANFARSPAISLPFGDEPLPIGMQLMAAPGEDHALIGIAAALERALAQG